MGACRSALAPARAPVQERPPTLLGGAAPGDGKQPAGAEAEAEEERLLLQFARRASQVDCSKPRLLLVSDNLPLFELLIRAAKESTVVVPVRYSTWGLDELVAALHSRAGRPRRQFASAGLLDHGAPGSFCLLKSVGNGWVDLEKIAGSVELQDFFRSLAGYVEAPEDPTRFRENLAARVDLMNCSVYAGEGRELLNYLEELTQTNWAASTNETGHGFDWVLESDTGLGDVAAAYFQEDQLKRWKFTARTHDPVEPPAPAEVSPSLVLTSSGLTEEILSLSGDRRWIVVLDAMAAQVKNKEYEFDKEAKKQAEKEAKKQAEKEAKAKAKAEKEAKKKAEKEAKKQAEMKQARKATTDDESSDDDDSADDVGDFGDVLSVEDVESDEDLSLDVEAGPKAHEACVKYVQQAEADFKLICKDAKKKSNPVYLAAVKCNFCLRYDGQLLRHTDFSAEDNIVAMLVDKLAQDGTTYDDLKHAFCSDAGDKTQKVKKLDSALHHCNAVFVCGGDPFSIDPWQDGWTKIKEHVNQKRLAYFSRSAGTIWAGDWIHSRKAWVAAQKEAKKKGSPVADVGSTDREGLGFVEKVIFPHAHTSGDKNFVLMKAIQSKEVSWKPLKLDDGQVYVDDPQAYKDYKTIRKHKEGRVVDLTQKKEKKDKKEKKHKKDTKEK